MALTISCIGNAYTAMKNLKKEQDQGFELWSSEWDPSILPLSHSDQLVLEPKLISQEWKHMPDLTQLPIGIIAHEPSLPFPMLAIGRKAIQFVGYTHCRFLQVTYWPKLYVKNLKTCTFDWLSL